MAYDPDNNEDDGLSEFEHELDQVKAADDATRQSAQELRDEARSLPATASPAQYLGGDGDYKLPYFRDPNEGVRLSAAGPDISTVSTDGNALVPGFIGVTRDMLKAPSAASGTTPAGGSTPVMGPPDSDQAWDVYRNAGVDPAYRGTQNDPFAGKPPSPFERLAQMYDPSAKDAKGQPIGPPVMTKPKWWQTALAAGIGGGAGWVNAAGRIRNPIDINAATQGILHPGYEGRLEEWQSRVMPMQQQMAAQEKYEQIEAQAEERRAHAQQRLKMADPHYNQSPIDPAWAKANLPFRKPDANGEYWMDKAQIAELETEFGKITVAPAGSSVWQGDKMVSAGTPKEQDIKITDEGIANLLGKKVGESVPISTYNKVIGIPKPDPVAQQNVNHWIAVAEDPNSTPEARANANAMLKRAKENTVGTHIAITNATQNQPMIPITPGSREYSVANDLASGKLTMAQFARLYSYSRDVNKKLDIYHKAEELNPNFDPAAFERGYGFSKNPQVMKQMASLNNVESGVPDLLKFSDLASRSGATVLNRAIIPGGIAVGGKKYSDFNTARIAFADELSGALGYGSATDMSREMGFNMTDPNLSPENFRSATENVIMPFIARKRSSLLGPMGIYGTQEMNPGANAPPKIETQVHNGKTYQRRKGSNDRWMPQ